jgi:hypothetical protein
LPSWKRHWLKPSPPRCNNPLAMPVLQGHVMI